MTDLPGIRRVAGYCALCWSSCGCISVVKDDRLLAVEPNPYHPTGDVLCAKGRAAPELVHHPERLLEPLKRTRPKGQPDPGWEKIGWDEALDTIAARLKCIATESGPEAVAFGITTPAGTGMQDGFMWVERLRNAFGCPHVITSAEVCDFHSQALNVHTFGCGLPMVDFENASCIVLWGHNASMTWIAHGSRIAKAKARGADLIVIDPRRAGLAAKADQWLRVRPGTDGALALGLANIMIENDWFDREFVRDWTNAPFLVRNDTGTFLTGADVTGEQNRAEQRVAWDEANRTTVLYDPVSRQYEGPCGHLALRGVVEIESLTCRPAFDLYAERCLDFSPERVEEVTWIPSSQVRATAELLSRSGPVALSCWAGLEQHTNAAQTSRAVALLYALTGSFDARGGNVIFEQVPLADLSGTELLSAEQRSKTLKADARPLGPEADGYITSESFYEAVLHQRPYPMRALVNFGPNLLVSHADADMGSDALAKIEFMVCADLFMTPTAALADIVLPVSTPWERDNVRSNFAVSQEAVGHLQYRPPVLQPAGQSRSDAWIAFALGKRLGLGEKFWDGDLDAAYRSFLEPSGVELEELKTAPNGIALPLATRYRKYAEIDRSNGFNTPSGKIEIYAQAFLDHGYDPLPNHVEPLMGPQSQKQLSKRFPLILTTAKTPHFLQSQMRGLPSLRRCEAKPCIEVHPDTARARGMNDGDRAVVTTPHSQVHVTVHLSAQLDPRVVSATHGWWQHCKALDLPGFEASKSTGANVNALIGHGLFDPITGSVPLKSYLCQVEPADTKC